MAMERKSESPGTDGTELDTNKELDAVRTELNELGIKFHPATGIVKLSALLEDTKADLDKAKKPGDNPVNTEIIAPKARKQVLIANQHTGGITLPRLQGVGLYTKPVRFPPGTVTPIDADEWAKHKKNPMVRHYLDRRLMAEVERVGPVPVVDGTSSSLVIPENLKTEAENEKASIRIERERNGEVEV